MEHLKVIGNYLLEAEHQVERYLLNDDKIDVVEGLPWIICSAIIWAVLDKLFEQHNKYAVSTFHSVALSIAGLLNLVILQHNRFEYLAFYFMAGYFLADFFINCIKPDFYIYSVHHLLTVGATYRMINGRNWNETMFASSCWLLELSTPFLNHYKVHKSATSAILFFVIFFIVRVVWLTRLSFTGWQVAINRLEFGIIVMFTALNYYWFFDIGRMGYRRLIKERKEQKKKSLDAE